MTRHNRDFSDDLKSPSDEEDGDGVDENDDEAKKQKKGEKRLLTRAGAKRIAEEHDHLLFVVRPRIVEGVKIAAAEGDRSENAEYIEGRKRLRETDKRLHYLGSLLKDIVIVDPDKLSGDKVCFGSTVVVRDEDGVEKDYTIVGEGEADLAQRTISYRSPVALALIGKKVGDIVLVRRPAGDAELEILELRFAGRTASDI